MFSIGLIFSSQAFFRPMDGIMQVMLIYFLLKMLVETNYIEKRDRNSIVDSTYRKINWVDMS